MATLYEVEHNIQEEEPRPAPDRRINMSTFVSFMETLHASVIEEPHNNPHATPTPADNTAAYRLVQDQMTTLHSTAPTQNNRDFLEDLIQEIGYYIDDPPKLLPSVSQDFLDNLDRVRKQSLTKDDDCAICKMPFLEDEYPLVVELPCQGKHRFDLECVSPWLRSMGTCPMCRDEMDKKKEPAVVEEVGSDEDVDQMYA
ncbi:putative RING finger protein [Cladobotryum mycophilum]|uniref:RING finger protein n=1 Tax=Cladobotryum mycophilum TaxID=491253 RepID=A0ABR0ST40_9HYPO